MSQESRFLYCEAHHHRSLSLLVHSVQVTLWQFSSHTHLSLYSPNCSTGWVFSSTCSTGTVTLSLQQPALMCYTFLIRDREREIQREWGEWWRGSRPVRHTNDITGSTHWGHSVSYSNWLWCDPVPRNPSPLASQPHDCALHKSLQAPAGPELR